MKGIEKHKLLRDDILPAMASNRKVQRLLNEFMDLLSEYESIETALDKKETVSDRKGPDSPSPELPSTNEKNQVDPLLQAKDQVNSVILETCLQAKDRFNSIALDNQAESASKALEQVNSHVLAMDQEIPSPAETDSLNRDPPATEHVEEIDPPKDTGS